MAAELLVAVRLDCDDGPVDGMMAKEKGACPGERIKNRNRMSSASAPTAEAT